MAHAEAYVARKVEQTYAKASGEPVCVGKLHFHPCGTIAARVIVIVVREADYQVAARRKCGIHIVYHRLVFIGTHNVAHIEQFICV